MFKTRLARIWQMSFIRWFVSGCLCLCLVAAALQIPGLRMRDFHLRYLSRQLGNLEEDALPDQFQQMLNYQQDGLPFVVDAMKHHRADVVARAELALEYEFEQWKALPIRESASRVEQLVTELAKINSELTNPSKLFAARIAVESLAWPISPDSESARTIARSAQTIIEATPNRTLTVDRPLTSPIVKVPIELPVAAPYDDTESSQPIDVSEPPAGNKGSTTAIADPSDNQKAAAIHSVKPSIQTDTKAPKLSPGPAPSSVPAPLPVQAKPEILPPLPANPVDSTIPIGNPSRPSQVVEEDETEQTADQPLAVELNNLKKLIELNGSAKPQFMTDAGFSSMDSRFAKWVNNAPYKELRKALQNLPTTRSLRADVWLVWFAQHGEPRLRMLAASIMASSADQRLLDYLKAWKTRETDASVIEHLDNLFDLLERR